MHQRKRPFWRLMRSKMISERAKTRTSMTSSTGQATIYQQERRLTKSFSPSQSLTSPRLMNNEANIPVHGSFFIISIIIISAASLCAIPRPVNGPCPLRKNFQISCRSSSKMARSIGFSASWMCSKASFALQLMFVQPKRRWKRSSAVWRNWQGAKSLPPSETSSLIAWWRCLAVIPNI